MSSDSLRVAKGLLSLAGHNPRLYVPGSLRLLVGGLMEWDERCGARCNHEQRECYMARSGLIPTGRVEVEE